MSPIRLSKHGKPIWRDSGLDVKVGGEEKRLLVAFDRAEVVFRFKGCRKEWQLDLRDAFLAAMTKGWRDTGKIEDGCKVLAKLVDEAVHYKQVGRGVNNLFILPHGHGFVKAAELESNRQRAAKGRKPRIRRGVLALKRG